jgi:hypothetical protein
MKNVKQLFASIFGLGKAEDGGEGEEINDQVEAPGAFAATLPDVPPVYYRKKAPTLARILTELDYDERGGQIQTNEGARGFLPGDYLAKDAKGEWPIPRTRMLLDYLRAGKPNADGFVAFRSRHLRKAMQMSGDFVVNGLTGKAGDYLVQEGIMQWPVDREIFESTYEQVDPAAIEGADDADAEDAAMDAPKVGAASPATGVSPATEAVPAVLAATAATDKSSDGATSQQQV